MSRKGRPPDQQKHAAILQAAARLFMQQGFERVTMDAIASEAGVSKLTIYNHFADKDSLLQATASLKLQQLLPGLQLPDEIHDLEHALMQVGQRFYRLLNDDESIALHRLMVSQVSRQPTLAASVYASGVQKAITHLAEGFQRLHDSGLLHIPDCRTAASHFTCLIRGNHTYQLILGFCQEFSEDVIEEHIRNAVRMFIRAYRATR